MLDPLSSLDEILKGKILLINKPKNWTSFDVVKKIKSTIKQKHNISKVKIGPLRINAIPTKSRVKFFFLNTKSIVIYL